MKKAIKILGSVFLLACSLTACGTAKTAENDDSKIQIVTTIFPEYDWLMNVLGDNPAGIEVTMLMDSGVDLHSFQPSADDILKITNSDLFIYVGGESDEWVEDAVNKAGGGNVKTINLLEVLGDSVKEEEVVEGMQVTEHSHAHETEEEHEEEHEHEEGPEYDEHVWLSLKRAAVLTESIADAVKELDPEHADTYEANASSYIGKLNELDAKYQEVTASAPVKTLVFGDRFPFRYLTDDYGLSYYAAFVGCSAESEASFETITFLAGKIDELDLHSVMTIEGKDHSIAETIIRNTASGDQKILTMDSLQSTTGEDVKAGITYLSVMEKNLEVLKEALQ